MSSSNPQHDSEVELDPAPSWYDECEFESTAVQALRTGHVGNPTPTTGPLEGQFLGDYQLIERVGVGGMGSVYRAVHGKSGQTFAVKVINIHLMARPERVARFLKEARLLGEVKSPYVTRMVEVNEDQGIHYIVMEFVSGNSLSWHLKHSGPLPERTALLIASQICSGLSDLHTRKIIHRDVKPGNVMIMSDRLDQLTDKDQNVSVKLTDLGTARQMIASEDHDLTTSQVLVGTPYYMAPEQSRSQSEVTPAADIYSLGAVLYHMVSGRPPFESDDLIDLIDLIDLHRRVDPPPLTMGDSKVSEGFSQLVMKAMSKRPEHRYVDASDMLEDVNLLLRGEPIRIGTFPRLPLRDLRIAMCYEISCKLKSSPSQLWRYISDTPRINRAVGLPPVEFSSSVAQNGDVTQVGNVRFAGFKMSWIEHPFEWIENHRMSILREFAHGPFDWIYSDVELRPAAGTGTELRQRIHVQPNGVAGRVLAWIQVGWITRRAFSAVYNRIDGFLENRRRSCSVADAFESAPRLSRRSKISLDQAILKLSERPISRELVFKLADFLEQATDPEIARIRPLDLAESWGYPEDELIDVCLYAAHDGLLDLQWEIHCPHCRVPVARRDSLEHVEDSGRCEVCDAEFPTDLAHRVEMNFSVNSEIRTADFRSYCLGGPAHSPHIVVQLRLIAGEKAEVPLQLKSGEYSLRIRQTSQNVDISVRETCRESHLELALTNSFKDDIRILSAGEQLLTIENQFERDVQVRLERRLRQHRSISAIEATGFPLFRQLFPRQVVGIDRPATIPDLTFMIFEFSSDDESSDDLAQAERTQESFRRFESDVREFGAKVLKTMGQRGLATFPDSFAAITAALQLNPTKCGISRVVIHRGDVTIATINGQLDFFGGSVKLANESLDSAGHGECLISDAIHRDEVMKSVRLTSKAVESTASGHVLRLS
ncbi:protein kinase [Thalassoglobus sp. JC818]|uniref:protein kinase domain-containing protein n=1 Tax=Thalassoglobus sp. JC818 TaxID=3232136 RepID=UPI0034588A6C